MGMKARGGRAGREARRKAKVIIRHWQLEAPEAAALLMVSMARRTHSHTYIVAR